MKHPFWLFFSLWLCSMGAGAVDNAGLKAGVFEPPRIAPDIALTATDGKTFSLSQNRGKVVVLEFGFTACAEVCPVSLASLAQARKLMGEKGNQVQVVFVTVDPERDTRPKLGAYLAHFDASFVGITGTVEQMAAVRQAYGITATKKMVEGSKTDYTVHHSSYLYFIDRQGLLRALMPFGRPAADIAQDLQLLLKS